MPEEGKKDNEDKNHNEDTVVQLYWAIFETWSAQVDSYWTRTNFFAAFQLAAIAGSWVVLDSCRLSSHRSIWFVGSAASMFAVGLTCAWIFSNLKSYDYHIYWWDVLEEIEQDGRWKTKPTYVSGRPGRMEKLERAYGRSHPRLNAVQYRNFTNWIVPIASFVVWVGVIFYWAMLRYYQLGG